MKSVPKSALALVLVLAGVGIWQWNSRNDTSMLSQGQAGALVEIQLPETLSATAQGGRKIFEANCASCHGVNAVGQEGVAPPLVHIIYEPGHHGDESFQRAAARGVRSHHWPFGNMPQISGITRNQVQQIVFYIRELQRANGIN